MNQKVIAFIGGAFVGYLINASQSCDFNVTGNIEQSLLSKKKISISFNGIQAIEGYLSSQNEANLIGSYKDKKATAQCSGAESITCQINYDNKEHTLNFKKSN